ncbi:MAG: transcription repressor NadR [Bacillota bacterium]|nr:transcription repressor NadR [Bacillota bacterium]
MDSNERRKYITQCLVNSSEPLKGYTLAEKLGVTRQVIVKDIAIMRAAGQNIIATPKGYVLFKKEEMNIKRIIAVSHKADDIQEELSTIVKYGGIIEDVIIEHPLYGEIKGMLMIKSLFDVENFMTKQKEYGAEPLSKLTGGVHLHTVIASNEQDYENILKALRDKGFLISE